MRAHLSILYTAIELISVVATSTSAVVQFRMLGGALILAVITSIMNSELKRTLVTVLSSEELARIFRTTKAIQELADPIRTVVNDEFLKGYNMQLRILIGFAGAEIPATLIMWQKERVKIA